MPVQLDTIELPDDLEWSDEFTWLPTAQQVEIAGSGALIIEESAVLAGRPITLEGRMDGSVGFALPTRATIKALRDLAAVPRVDPMVLLLHGETFNVRFDNRNGAAVEAHAMRHIVPHEDADYYTLTVRLIQV